MSATHSTFGAATVKFRSTRSRRPGHRHIRDRGSLPFATDPAREPDLAHQSLDPAAPDRRPFALQLPPHLAGPVDAEVLGMHAPDLRHQLRIPQRARRRRSLLGRVVRGRGELQRRADRLDPEAIAVRVDERNYLVCRRSSSAPKKAAALLRISLARRNSAFSLSS